MNWRWSLKRYVWNMKDSRIALNQMELSEEIESVVNNLLSERSNIEMVEPWVQGDHMLFAMARIPVLALTSKNIFRLIDKVVHTEKDNLELVDYSGVLEAVYFLKDLILKI